VTESRMGIALSELGGIGIIHKNLSIQAQAAEVRKVKKYESGIVRDPITIRSDNEVGELIQLTNELNISGMPVVDNDELVGIVTSRDFRYQENHSVKVSEIMTPKERLITAKEGESPDVIKKLLQVNRIEKILLIDDSFKLTGLVTLKDINKSLFKIIRNIYRSEDSVLAVFLSRVFNTFLVYLLKSEVKDVTSGFIIGRKEYFKKDIFEDANYGDYFIFLVLSLMRRNVELKEIGYVCLTRVAGYSKTSNSITDLFKKGLPYIKIAIMSRKK